MFCKTIHITNTLDYYNRGRVSHDHSNMFLWCRHNKACYLIIKKQQQQICIFVHNFFIICVLSCHWHSVALWSFCHQNKFLVCVNIPGNKANSDSDSEHNNNKKPVYNKVFQLPVSPWSKNDAMKYKHYSSQEWGLTLKNRNKKSIFCSPRLHLLDQKYRNNEMKYYYNLK